MKLESGHVVTPLEGEELKKQTQDWEGYTEGLVRLTPGRWVFPTKYQLYADKLYNFKFRSSDVVIMTYPKCGTTWTQEIVWTMRNNPDLNHPDAGEFVLARSPFIDMDMLLPTLNGPAPMDDPIIKAFLKHCPGKNPQDGLNIQVSEAIADPRTIKTHLPFSLMPPSMLDTSKVIYVARNPKDLIISYLHHSRINVLHGYVGNFEDFVQYFVDGDVVYGPYWLHMKEAWEKKNHPNLHIMFFEDMKANPIQELRKLNTFLNTNLTEAQLEGIAKFTNFKEMKARSIASGFNEEELPLFKSDIVKRDGGFFRKGEAGDWKGKFTPALDAKVDEWTKKNMTSFGVEFSYGK